MAKPMPPMAEAENPAEDAAQAQPEDQQDESAGAPMDGNELCVDLNALSMPDESDKMEPPAVGDKVQAMVEGEVSRIEGDKAYVTMSAVNGQPVKESEAPPTEEDQTSQMRDMAAAQPPNY